MGVYWRLSLITLLFFLSQFHLILTDHHPHHPHQRRLMNGEYRGVRAYYPPPKDPEQAIETVNTVIIISVAVGALVLLIIVSCAAIAGGLCLWAIMRKRNAPPQPYERQWRDGNDREQRSKEANTKTKTNQSKIEPSSSE